MDPGVDPAIFLFERCARDGGVCLPLAAIVASGVAADGAALFTVHFANDDGSIFGQGPCCGEPDAGTRRTEFAFTVREIEGALRTMELPPYVP
jgi:hypothetical protein